jgi:hypothetical protein
MPRGTTRTLTARAFLRPLWRKLTAAGCRASSAFCSSRRASRGSRRHRRLYAGPRVPCLALPCRGLCDSPLRPRC